MSNDPLKLNIKEVYELKKFEGDAADGKLLSTRTIVYVNNVVESDTTVEHAEGS